MTGGPCVVRYTTFHLRYVKPSITRCASGSGVVRELPLNCYAYNEAKMIWSLGALFNRVVVELAWDMCI